MNTQDKIQREILPIPDIPHVGLTTYDAKDPDTRYPSIEPLHPPTGAPNVLKDTRLHTTALRLPTRQALPTGCNHHTAGMRPFYHWLIPYVPVIQ